MISNILLQPPYPNAVMVSDDFENWFERRPIGYDPVLRVFVTACQECCKETGDYYGWKHASPKGEYEP